MTTGPLRPAVRLENIDYLVALESFHIHILDINTENILPVLGCIMAQNLSSLEIGLGVTLLGDSPFKLSNEWNTFRDIISNRARFPRLAVIDICISDTAQCGRLFLKLTENNLKYVFLSLVDGLVNINIHLRGE